MAFSACATLAGSASAFDVAPQTSDNVIHLQLDDRVGALDGTRVGVEVVDVPEWMTITSSEVIDSYGQRVEIRFDVTSAPLGDRGHLSLRLTGEAPTGESLFARRHIVPLLVRGTVEDVQREFGVEECCMVVVGVHDPAIPPSAHTMVGATPNPLRSLTNIVFGLPVEGGVVSLSIYDVQGRRVFETDTPRLAGGFHRITWDGRDLSGSAVSPGTYFYELRSGTWTETRKLQVIR